MITLEVYSLYGPKAASHRIRLGQFLPAMKEAGFRLRIQSLLDNCYLRRRFRGLWPDFPRIFLLFIRRIRRLLKAKKGHGAIVYAELFPGLPYALERLLLPRTYIYDLDDSFFLKYRTGKLAFLRPFLSDKIDRLMQGAAAITAGNSFLCDYAATASSRVIWLPSSVDTLEYRPGARALGEVFTIGWIGSPSTEIFLDELVEPLKRLGVEQALNFLVVGGAFPYEIPGVRVLRIPWSLETEVSLIQKIDVGLMPLSDNEWSWGKCGFKLITYMACGLPVVASEVGANKEIVDDECGFLVYTPEEWVEAIRKLRDNPEMRRQMGEVGRRKVCEEYSLEKTSKILRKTLEEVFGKQSPEDGGR